MKFESTKLADLWLLQLEKKPDSRGFFARTYCEEEFRQHGLNTRWPQCNTSFNKLKGTLRGMHWQLAPYEEIKLVRCTRGAIYDVVVDIRPGSRTFGQWQAFELTEENGAELYIPGGFAHGFQTLLDDTEVFYFMSQTYHAESARGFHWQDPAVGIVWPEASHRVISDRDANFPLLKEVR